MKVNKAHLKFLIENLKVIFSEQIPECKPSDFLNGGRFKNHFMLLAAKTQMGDSEQIKMSLENSLQRLGDYKDSHIDTAFKFALKELSK